MIERVSSWFHRESSSITVAALLLAAASFAADILGLVRDRILAAQFGAGEVLDIYYAGFRIPDLLLNLLVLGAMSSAFLPMFAERYARDRTDAWRFAQNLLTLVAFSLVVFAGALYFLAPSLMGLVAPGFTAEQAARAASVTRMLLLSPILFGISSLISAVLHFFRRFFLYSLAPILYNAGIIIGASVLAPVFSASGRSPEIGIAAGVILGAVMHLCVQLPGLWNVGFRFRPSLRPIHSAIAGVIRLSIPRTGTLVLYQLYLTALTAMASAFAVGSIAVFNLGRNISSITVGVIGISFATAAFPVFSRAAAAGDRSAFSRAFRQTAQEVLFFAAPLSVLFLVLRAHIVRVILGSGAFSWEDTRLTAAVLGALTFGIVAETLLPLFVRVFFAQKNTVTPFLVSLGSAVGNVVLAFWLSAALGRQGVVRAAVGWLFRVADLSDIRVVALPVTIALVLLAQLVVYIFLVRRYLEAQDRTAMLASAIRLGLSSLAAGGAAWTMLQVLVSGIAQETFIGIFIQGFLAGVTGIVIYLFLAVTFAFPEARRLVALLRQSLPPLAAILPELSSDGEEEEKRGMEQ